MEQSTSHIIATLFHAVITSNCRRFVAIIVFKDSRPAATIPSIVNFRLTDGVLWIFNLTSTHCIQLAEVTRWID